MKIVSYGLWGQDPKYCVGAVRNAELCAKFYPDWTPIFYHGLDVPEGCLKDLLFANSQTCLVGVSEPSDWFSVFWRYRAFLRPDADIVIFRDTDSRIGQREVEAVKQWENSPMLAHIMRDHPQGHRQYIMPGMFGLKRGAVPNFDELLSRFSGSDRYGTDYGFFDSIIYPIVKDTALVHDEFFEKKPFPSKRAGLDFVGQVFDANDKPHEGHAIALSYYLKP